MPIAVGVGIRNGRRCERLHPRETCSPRPLSCHSDGRSAILVSRPTTTFPYRQHKPSPYSVHLQPRFTSFPLNLVATRAVAVRFAFLSSRTGTGTMHACYCFPPASVPHRASANDAFQDLRSALGLFLQAR